MITDVMAKELALIMFPAALISAAVGAWLGERLSTIKNAQRDKEPAGCPCLAWLIAILMGAVPLALFLGGAAILVRAAFWSLVMMWER